MKILRSGHVIQRDRAYFLQVMRICMIVCGGGNNRKNLNNKKGTNHIVSAYLWSDWRNWRSYHSTILFLVMGDFLYNFLTYNYSLWELHSELGGHTVNDLMITLVTFPSVVLLMLTHFPYHKKMNKKA